MNSMEITFQVAISKHNSEEYYSRKGPLFHQWLPNGRKDAINVNFDDLQASVAIWFERRGYVDSRGMIEYDVNRCEVDDSVMVRQGKLDAGMLYGSIMFENVTDDVLNAINNNILNEHYSTFGKIIIKKIVDPLLIRFTKILRDTYGQYWLVQHHKFDSRKHSLGSHCQRLGMIWKLSDGKSGVFKPTEGSSHSTISVFVDSYVDYIDKDSWEKIGELLVTNFEPTTASSISSRANSLYQEGRIAHALIEAVTALEVCLEEYVRKRINNDKTFTEIIKKFWDLSLPARTTLIASFCNVDGPCINNAVAAIKARNDVVHEGKSPDPKSKIYILAVFKILKVLINDPQIKFPSDNYQNQLIAAQE